MDKSIEGGEGFLKSIKGRVGVKGFSKGSVGGVCIFVSREDQRREEIVCSLLTSEERGDSLLITNLRGERR